MSKATINNEEVKELLGPSLFCVYKDLISLINEKYDMEQLQNHGGKKWVHEYKFRRGGKTLCCLYANKNSLGFMVIFGKDEREKFETERNDYSKEVRKVYNEAQTYHDGKWMMFYPIDNSLFEDFEKLLKIKRKPNRK